MAQKISADDLQALAAELQALKDRVEIRETIERYWYGEDRCAPAVVASVFTPDARYGMIRGRDEVERVMAGGGLAAYDAMAHCFGSSRIEVDGDTATADTMAIGFDVGRNDDGERVCMVRGLRYVDTLVRTEHGWQISSRSGYDDLDFGHDTFWQFEGPTTELWHPTPPGGAAQRQDTSARRSSAPGQSG